MTKKKLYIVHGWTYSLDKWGELLVELSNMGYEPVMLTVPGLSKPSDDVWDIPKYVSWLESQLEHEKSPIVIGHSNGGRIAMAYDVKHPGNLDKLILISSAGIFHDEAPISLKRKLFGRAAKLLKPLSKSPLRKLLYRLIGASDYGNAKPNMRQTMQNVIEFDKTFDLSKVSAKTTLIWGEQDMATPLSDGQMIQSKLPNADELHVIHGAGHSAHADDPDRVAQIIKSTVG